MPGLKHVDGTIHGELMAVQPVLYLPYRERPSLSRSGSLGAFTSTEFPPAPRCRGDGHFSKVPNNDEDVFEKRKSAQEELSSDPGPV